MEEESTVCYVPGSDHDDVEVGTVEGDRIYLGMTAKGSGDTGNIFDMPNVAIDYYLTTDEARELSSKLKTAIEVAEWKAA